MEDLSTRRHRGRREKRVFEVRALSVSTLSRIAIAILVLCAIGTTTAPAAEPGRERVLIGVSSKSIGFFDPWVAHEKGFFRKHGIDSEVITIRPNLSVVALHAGEIDYSWMTGTVIRAAAKGIPLRLVTIGLKSSFHTLVARPNFESINELRGKKIAISNIGATDDLVARALLQKAGLDPKRDAAVISMGGSETRYQALLAGQMDAATLSLPHSVLAKQQGFSFLGSAGDVLQIPFTGISTTAAKIQRNREQVKRMIRAQIDAMHWIKNQKADAIRFLREFFDTDEATALESYNIYVPLIIEDVRVSAEGVKAVLAAEGAANVSWEQVADPSLVGEVLKKK
jgi:NitT/TauT family transport system substrate-binding protein